MSIYINKKLLIIRTIGNALILISLSSIIFTFWPIISVKSKRFIENLQGKSYVAAKSTQTFGQLLGKDDPNTKILVPADPNFSLIVEKIGANASVVPNVDPGNKKVYLNALKKGIAHANGTSFPGEKGVTYLFAHSTDNIFNVPRYNAVFYLLGDLKKDDRIVIFFANKRFDYKVTETKITDPQDVYYLTLKTEEQILVLQTCYPPGTVWKRLLVIAKPAESN